MTARTRATLPVVFADGTERRIPADVAGSVVGLDSSGYVVAESDGMLYPLTPCCYASGKGSVNSPTGVCCRACYAAVEAYLGVVLEQSDVIVRLWPAHAMDANAAPLCGYTGPLHAHTTAHHDGVTCPACRVLIDA